MTRAKIVFAFALVLSALAGVVYANTRPYTGGTSVVTTSYTASEDLLASDLELGEDYPTVGLALQVENHTGSALVLSVVKRQAGGTELISDLNGGNAIPSGTVATFSYLAVRKDAGGKVLTYNFRADQSGTLSFSYARVENGGL